MNTTLERFTHGLKNFLGLTSLRETLSELEQAADRTQFSDIDRRLRIYLRALWDSDFVMKPAESDSENEQAGQPYLENLNIHLPSAIGDYSKDDVNRLTGMEIYRAAAAHAAAHLVYGQGHFSPRSLDRWQRAMISLIEDARVEALAIRQFPGLKHLWAKQHHALPQDDRSAGDYMNRLARALLDETYLDDDPWIVKGRALFHAVGDLEQKQVARDIGLRLAAMFHDKQIGFNARTDKLKVPYRDDHRHLWRPPGEAQEIVNPYRKSKTTVKVDAEGKDTRELVNPEIRESKSDKPVHETFVYPEWNYRSQSFDQSWVTIRESDAATGELKVVEDIIAHNRHLVTRMKNILHAVRDGSVRRIRKLEVGDEIDVNAAIRAQIDIRQGLQPDPRIMMRLTRKTRDISVLMLLDLSKSMNDLVPGREETALQLIQQVSVLFAEAIEGVGDPFAIHGFSSASRHNVEYFRLKDFDQPYDDGPKARLAGIEGIYGTRMGAAIRHATHYLNKQKAEKKLLILLSDGAPNDIDVPDKRYLRDDTRKSVEEAEASGVRTYCVSLDPGADQYVSRIFGARNYMVVDHIRSLPEKILLLYAALTR